MSNDTKCRTSKMLNGTKRRKYIMLKVKKAEWDKTSNGTKCPIEIILNATKCRVEIMSNGTKRRMTKCRMGQNVAKPGTELQQHEPEGLPGWCDLLLE